MHDLRPCPQRTFNHHYHYYDYDYDYDYDYYYYYGYDYGYDYDYYLTMKKFSQQAKSCIFSGTNHYASHLRSYRSLQWQQFTGLRFQGSVF